jgi:4-amino-4-deoxy-L-arabinose transferase-like glycosyltransferase
MFMRSTHVSLERLFWLLGVAFVALFASMHVRGLQPDAALYAGLARKVLETGESWLLAGTEGKFPKFFEHPPYFFQWGAWIFSKFGMSDATARLMGAGPAFLGMVSLLVWCWVRLGWGVAAWCAVALATYGHFTKYAATAMLEGPLALGLAWTGIAAFELLWMPGRFLKRIAFVLLLFAGLMISTAIKGVVGLGAWGGLLLSLGTSVVVRRKPAWKLYLSFFPLGFCLLVTAAPLLLWAFRLFQRDGLLWIQGYIFEQVFRSATTDRGEAFFQEATNRLYYLQGFVRNGWPWWWSVPAAWICHAASYGRHASHFLQPFRRPIARYVAINGCCFLLAFLVPLSFVSYKLPHYMHPTYLLLAPAGAIFLAHGASWLWERACARWSPLQRISPFGGVMKWALLLPVLAWVSFRGPSVSTTPNRGQEFIRIAHLVKALDARCPVHVPEEQMDAYRMEAYTLWYFGPREWKLVKHEYPARIAVPWDSIYWNPTQNFIWGRGRCEL